MGAIEGRRSLEAAEGSRAAREGVRDEAAEPLGERSAQEQLEAIAVSRDAIGDGLDAGVGALQLIQTDDVGGVEQDVLKQLERAGDGVPEVDLRARAALQAALQALTGSALQAGNRDREAGRLMGQPDVMQQGDAVGDAETRGQPRLGRERGDAVSNVGVEAKARDQRDPRAQIEALVDPGASEDLVADREHLLRGDPG